MPLDLLALTEKLVSIPSVSKNEAAISQFVFEKLQKFEHLKITRIGDNIVAQTSIGSKKKILLAGHIDTVPPNANEAPNIANGRLYGLGSTDMKSGIAVMLGLAEQSFEFSANTTFLFYAREEIASSQSGLLEIEKYDAGFLEGNAAILFEPTSSRIEGGCQGTMRVAITLVGKRAHTARPWMGENAIHRAGDLISKVSRTKLRSPEIDGLQFRESLQVVAVTGGIANNVVPDSAEIILNYRFAPDFNIIDANEYLSSLFTDILRPGDGDLLDVIEAVPGALPNLDNEVFDALLSTTGGVAHAKLGWTDVSFFASRGIAATNFGPGEPLLAHTKDEYVEISKINQAYRSMIEVLTN